MKGRRTSQQEWCPPPTRYAALDAPVFAWKAILLSLMNEVHGVILIGDDEMAMESEYNTENILISLHSMRCENQAEEQKKWHLMMQLKWTGVSGVDWDKVEASSGG